MYLLLSSACDVLEAFSVKKILSSCEQRHNVGGVLYYDIINIHFGLVSCFFNVLLLKYDENDLVKKTHGTQSGVC